MPSIIRREEVYSNRWVTLVRKDLDTGEDYYVLETCDYAVVVALTPDRRIPLVRQFRPCLERTTLEPPAGWIEPDESPLEACSRELLEETGVLAVKLHPLGKCAADPGRLSNYQHAFFAECLEADPAWRPEEGVEVVWVDEAELYRLFQAGELQHSFPVAASFLAGHLQIPNGGRGEHRVVSSPP